MNKLDITVIISVIGLVLFIGYIWSLEVKSQQDLKHSDYCNNWSDRIDKRQADINSTWFPGDAVVAQFNSEINQYNHECVGGGS
jgi:hypothetical protein